MEITKLKKIVDDLIAEKKKGTENNLLPAVDEIKRMVDNKISIAKQVLALRRAGIKTNQKRLTEFIKHSIKSSINLNKGE